jgi:hypothetical protein
MPRNPRFPFLSHTPRLFGRHQARRRRHRTFPRYPPPRTCGGAGAQVRGRGLYILDNHLPYRLPPSPPVVLDLARRAGDVCRMERSKAFERG